MAMQRKIKMKVLYKGRLLGIIETTPKISRVEQFKDEEKEQKDVIIKNVTSLTKKKVTTSTMKKVSSSTTKKVSSSTMKNDTISPNKRIKKVHKKLVYNCNRFWRRAV